MAKAYNLTSPGINDPHVVALVYRIVHGDRIDYSQAKPFQREESGFRLSVQDGLARFDFEDHHPTVEAAMASIRDYIHAWEFDAQLKNGPDSFNLALDRTKSEIVDRNPGSEARRLHFPTATMVGGAFEAAMVLRRSKYPVPAPDLSVNSESAAMHRRFMAYKRGNDTLPTVANFCVTLLESSVDRKDKRKNAARKYGIDRKVLEQVGFLADAKGGPDEARKSKGIGSALSKAERRFLEAALKAIIRRAAELEGASAGGLPRLLLSDLPPLFTTESAQDA